MRHIFNMGTYWRWAWRFLLTEMERGTITIGYYPDYETPTFSRDFPRWLSRFILKFDKGHGKS